MRQIHVENDPYNEAKSFSFYNASQGYVAFDQWIGYTQDTGRTFVKKFITNSNVNYNNNFVNLTFGFWINGVHAFSHDTLIVYGQYGFSPSILYSDNGGNSFSLVYWQPFNQNFLYRGVFEASFPSHSSGFAVIEDRILKTSNKGLSWTTVFTTSTKDLFGIQFTDPNNRYAFGKNLMFKTTNGGTSWQSVAKPAGILQSAYFLNSSTGWLNQGALFKTIDGGVTWAQKNEVEFYTVGNPMHWTNDTTGYATSLFYTWKTSDGGKIWERLERDNSFEYLYYGHTALYFFNKDSFLAGGGLGFIESKKTGAVLLFQNPYFS